MNSAVPAQQLVEPTGHEARAPSRSYFATPQASFLNNGEELAMIVLPWIGVAIGLGLCLSGLIPFNYILGSSMELLFVVIGLDALHILFSFVLVVSSPELRTWAKHPDSKAQSGWMKGLLPNDRAFCMGLAFAAIYVVIKGFYPIAGLRGMLTLYMFFEMLGPAQHTLAQMRGLSLCYNSALKKKFNFSEAEKLRAVRCERSERWLFRLLLVSDLLYWAPPILSRDNFHIEILEKLSPLMFALTIFSAFGLVLNAFLYPRAQESRKLSYISRVALFPLLIVNTFAGVSLRVAHGTEYLFVYRRMLRASDLEKKKRHRVYWVTAILSLILAVPFILTWPEHARSVARHKMDDILLTVALAAIFGLRYAHYYLDSVIYRMSDPAVRKVVAPLLTDEIKSI